LRGCISRIGILYHTRQMTFDLISTQSDIRKHYPEECFHRRCHGTPGLFVIWWISHEVRRDVFNELSDVLIALRPYRRDGGNEISLELLIDRGVYAANIVYLVRQLLLTENFSYGVPPRMRDLLANVPEEIAIDQADRVEKI